MPKNAKQKRVIKKDLHRINRVWVCIKNDMILISLIFGTDTRKLMKIPINDWQNNLTEFIVFLKPYEGRTISCSIKKYWDEEKFEKVKLEDNQEQLNNIIPELKEIILERCIVSLETDESEKSRLAA